MRLKIPIKTCSIWDLSQKAIKKFMLGFYKQSIIILMPLAADLAISHRPLFTKKGQLKKLNFQLS